jgi:hypothetical protein
MTNDASPVLWNEERETLYELIKRVNPTLAGLYHRAILLMSEPPGPGEEKARFSLVGHCFRELMNRLPDWLQDVDGFPASRRQEEDKALDRLVAEYESFRGSPNDQPTASSNDPQQEALVSVPASLIDALGRFINAREEGSRNVLERDAAAVLGAVGLRGAALKPWRDARAFFMSCTHLDRQYEVEAQVGAVPSDEVVMEHIAATEASLRVRLGAFFDSYEELKDLIAQANQTVEEGSPA